MAKGTTVELGRELGDFVSAGVAKGRYRSASEVIRAGLRLLQAEEAKLEALRAALVLGEESGDPVRYEPGALERIIEGSDE